MITVTARTKSGGTVDVSFTGNLMLEVVQRLLFIYWDKKVDELNAQGQDWFWLEDIVSIRGE